MKRIILRVAVLAVVVVSGVIAIAYAQRGANNGASAAAEPGVIAGQPPKVLAVGRQSPAAAPSAATAQPSSRPPSIDPFGFRNSQPLRPADTGVRQTSAEADPASGAMPKGPASGTAVRPAVAEDTRYPQLAAPPAGRGASGPPPAAAAANDPPPIGDRPPASAADPPPIGDRPAAIAAEPPPSEPAPFKVDPLAAPAKGGPSGVVPPGLPVRPDAAAPAAALAADGPVQPPAGPATTEATLGGEGTGRPGTKQLEGPQTPQLTVQKFAPQELQVGKPAKFRVTVRNTGSTAASGVEVCDQIPKGTRLIDTTPRASRGVRGELVWTLGTIRPGEESSVEVQLMPITEGEIGSVATVSFNADASARAVATKPQLVLETAAASQVLIGEEVSLSIAVSNPGTGVATKVVLEEHVPAGLRHTAGAALEYELGNLPPGESRKLELKLQAQRPGPATNLLVARGEGNLRTEDRRNLEVIAPELDVAMEGPKRRYLEREATYQLSIVNPGTAPARQVDLVAYLPSGLKFVSANNAGQYEEANRAVHWRLEELPVNEKGTVELVTLPTEPGQQSIKLRATAQQGLAVEKEQPVLIEGIAALLFQVADTADPIEAGGETSYEIRVVNQGSKAATNVQVSVLLPPEMKPVAAEGPTRHAVEGTTVVFDGLSSLAPKAETAYRVRVQGLRPGDLRTRVQLKADDMQSPVVKEESTRVYADE